MSKKICIFLAFLTVLFFLSLLFFYGFQAVKYKDIEKKYFDRAEIHIESNIFEASSLDELTLKAYFLFPKIWYTSNKSLLSNEMIHMDVLIPAGNVKVLVDKTLPGTAISIHFDRRDYRGSYFTTLKTDYSSAAIFVQSEEEKIKWENCIKEKTAQALISIREDFQKRYKKLNPESLF